MVCGWIILLRHFFSMNQLIQFIKWSERICWIQLTDSMKRLRWLTVQWRGWSLLNNSLIFHNEFQGMKYKTYFYDTFMVLIVTKVRPGYSLKNYLTQCYKEDRKSYRSTTTWWCVNNVRIFILWRTIPLRILLTLFALQST